jgi:hypothetical protein
MALLEIFGSKMRERQEGIMTTSASLYGSSVSKEIMYVIVVRRKPFDNYTRFQSFVASPKKAHTIRKRSVYKEKRVLVLLKLLAGKRAL